MSNSRLSRSARSVSWYRKTSAAFVLLSLFAATLILPPSWFSLTPRAEAASTDLVISQVYGGGGNSGATFKNDFIEIFNRGSAPVSLAGKSVQYTSATGTGNFAATGLPSVSLQPGQYFLIQEAAGTGTAPSLPTPDATGGINMSGSDGKVALVNSSTALACNGGSTPCTSAQLALIIDLAGYGTANFFEGTAAPGLSNSTSDSRKGNGCTDTDNNSADFSTGAPSPRNSASPVNNCSVGSNAAPTITPPADPITTVAQDAPPFDVSLAGSDDNNVFNWSATPGTGVSSVTVASGRGTANVTYNVTLMPGFSGTATFTAGLSDNVNSTVTKAVNIVVTPAPRTLGPVAISQVYGGGGNTGSTLKNDFIELINRSGSPVDLTGWSVQAFSSSTSQWNVTPLTGVMLQPGQYYLVQEAPGDGGTDDLPPADATGSILVSSTSSVVALVSNTTTLTSSCPSGNGIVDLVGYGLLTPPLLPCFEGSGPAPTLTNTTAALRLNDGCFDTNDNALDLVSGEPTPRNTSSPAHDCTGISGFGTATPSNPLQGQSTALSVRVADAQNPASTGISVVADLSSIGGSPTQAFTGSGDTFTFNATVSASAAPGLKALPITISDAQGRSFQTDIKMSVLSLIPDHIVISQVYGGGGNSGATFTNDYVELYNPTASTVTITGWTLQYASASGTSWTNNQPLGGTIGSHQYYLVQLASGGAVGAPLPTAPNISGDINMSATTGKIALVKNSDALAGGCPIGTDPDIVDFVGYGGASCHEGTDNAPAPNNTNAIFRKNDGNTDTDQNRSDFITGLPNPRRTEPIVELGPWVAGTDPSTNATVVPHDDTVTVNFSEPVDVDPGWYNITCSITGSHNDATVAHTSDFKAYAITPNVNFQFGEQCSVTIPKTTIHDQDLDDSAPDTDTLFADYTWSFTVVAAGQPAPFPPSVHLTMGDPSCGSPVGCATADLGDPDNYLMEKPTYALSYNRDRGEPNWVSWHLSSEWYGSLPRVDTFRADPQVPADWYRVESFDYSGSGFDRGHMTPNADRDNQNRVPINQETYLMSNMVPQSPDNNQGPWAQFEGYLRSLTDMGSELYIVSGPFGQGGTGSSGGVTNTIANGHVTVPAFTWKVVLVLPKGDDDINRVTAATRTIAIQIPNIQGIRNVDWHNYLTTVDAIQNETGYDFFSNVPQVVQNSIEAGTDGANPPGTADQTVQATEDTPVNFTLNAVNPGDGGLTATVSQPTSGQVSCTNTDCTYTPTANFNGTDSFTYTVTNGTLVSNTSTVTINVASVNDAPLLAVIPAQTVNLGSSLQFTASGSDVDLPNDTLTYSLAGTVPAGASIDPVTGVFQWTPTADEAGSVYSIRVRVTDAGGLFAEQTVSIGVAFTWSDIFGSAVNGGPAKAGSSVPIKFKLTGASSSITDAQISLYIAPVVDGVVGTETPAVARGNANNGDLFAYDPATGEYYFIWNTSGLTPGTYQLRIDTGDGVNRTTLITLK